jgi:hypothetical protein
MRRAGILFGVLFAMLVTSGVPGEAEAQVSASLFVVRCRTDDEIPVGDRQAAEVVAMDLARAILNGDAVLARSLMTFEAQAATPPDQLDGILRFVKALAPYTDLRVEHDYQIDISKLGTGPLPKTHCGKDQDALMLSVFPGSHQMDVAISAKTNNNSWSLFMVLAPDDGGWKALSFHVDAKSASGRSSIDLQRMAEAQAKAGHKLNAALLYSAAVGLADRGPNATPVWRAELDREYADLALPSALKHTAPFGWNGSDPALGAATVKVTGIGGGFGLIFQRYPAVWVDDATADRESRAFATSVVSGNPELREVFAAVIVQAMHPDGSGWFGTVYEFDKGFLDHKTVPTGH